MMRDSNDNKAKIKLETVLELQDGSSILGIFFVTPQARLTDLLSDSREFLPIEMTDGTLTVVRKDAIVRATPLQQKSVVEGENILIATLCDCRNLANRQAADHNVIATRQRRHIDDDFAGCRWSYIDGVIPQV